MNKLICIAVLCLLSFQSHAKEEIWSDDDNNIFVQSADIKVLKQGIGLKTLRYSKKKYGDKEGFIKACLGKCTSKNAGGAKKACGGIVVMYSNKKKKTPKKCAFKKREANSKEDKAGKWEFYKSICYAGGPYRFSTPKDKGSCKQFGLKKVGKGKNAVVAGDSNEDDSNKKIRCKVGDPYTAENDAACQAAGKKACWKGGNHCECEGHWGDYQCNKTAEQCGSPWVVGNGYDRSWIHSAYDFRHEDVEECYRMMAISDTGYGAEHHNNEKWRNLSCTVNRALFHQEIYYFDKKFCHTPRECWCLDGYTACELGYIDPNDCSVNCWATCKGCDRATLQMKDIPLWGGWDEWEYRAKPWLLRQEARCN